MADGWLLTGLPRCLGIAQHLVMAFLGQMGPDLEKDPTEGRSEGRLWESPLESSHSLSPTVSLS